MDNVTDLAHVLRLQGPVLITLIFDEAPHARPVFDRGVVGSCAASLGFSSDDHVTESIQYKPLGIVAAVARPVVHLDP